MEVQLGIEVQEYPAESDFGAVHEHELARHFDRSLVAQTLMHLEGLAPTIGTGTTILGDGAHAILEHGAIDEVRPDIEDVDQLVGKPCEAPGLVGVHHERTVVVEQTSIKIDHPLDEFWRE